ncbi:hypothetical protein D3C81_1443930 [compost metagenome]
MQQLGQPFNGQLAVVIDEAGIECGADHLLGRHAVDLLSESAHEGHFAARHDIRPEAVRPQVLQKFEHGLEDHFGVRLVAARVHGRCQPTPGVGDEVFGTDPGMGSSNDLQNAIHTAVGEGLLVALQHRLERLLSGPLRVLRGQPFNLVESEQHFEIQRLFAPQGAVIVEHSNALGLRHVILATLGGHGGDEGFDGLA